MSETSSNTPKTPEIYKCCDNPQITYLAPVNINIDEKNYWFCRCLEMCCMYEIILRRKKHWELILLLILLECHELKMMKSGQLL